MTVQGKVYTSHGTLYLYHDIMVLVVVATTTTTAAAAAATMQDCMWMVYPFMTLIVKLD